LKCKPGGKGGNQVEDKVEVEEVEEKIGD